MATNLLAPFFSGFLNSYTTQGSQKAAVNIMFVSCHAPFFQCLFFLHMHPSFRWWAPLTFPRARLCRKPRKAEETHQGSVHFFAFLPSHPPPGRHRPLPVMHQVPRWVKLTEEKKHSLIRSVWEWPEEAAPKHSCKTAGWSASIRRKLLCVQLFRARDSKYKKVQIVHPQGSKAKQQIVRLND